MNNKKNPIYITLLLGGISASVAHAAPTWDGSGDINNSGDWSLDANWDGVAPTTGDDVILGDVTSGTRTVTFDGSNGSLESLTQVQTTDNANNVLSLEQTGAQTVTVTDAITLGTAASNSTVQLNLKANSGVDSSTAVLTSTGGVTVNDGGILSFDYGDTAKAFTAISGDLTVNTGGMVTFKSPNATKYGQIGNIDGVGLASSDTFTINGGTFRIESQASPNPAGSARVVIAANLNWQSGLIEYASSDGSTTGFAQQIILSGLTNTIGEDAVFQRISGGAVIDTTPNLDLRISTSSSTPSGTVQTLDSAIDLGNIRLYEHRNPNNGVYLFHKITSTSADQKIGKVEMVSYGSQNVFLLGSDLNSTHSGSDFITSTGYYVSGNNRRYQVNLGGHTFDGSLADSWTPNRMAGSPDANSYWEVLSSTAGGVLRAKRFDLSLSGALDGDSFTLGDGATLEATGTSGSANTLTGATAIYTFDAGSTFRYAGDALASNAATVTSDVTIGNLEVQNGALNLDQVSFDTAGYVAVSAGGTLDLNDVSAGALDLASGQDFSVDGGTLLLSVGDASVLDAITGSGAGTFSFETATIVLSLGAGFDYNETYAILSGFASGSVTDLTISGYDDLTYLATLGTDGVLGFSAIPEASNFALALALGASFMVWTRKRK